MALRPPPTNPCSQLFEGQADANDEAEEDEENYDDPDEYRGQGPPGRRPAAAGAAMAAVPPEVVSGTAAPTPLFTRAGGQDDSS